MKRDLIRQSLVFAAVLGFFGCRVVKEEELPAYRIMEAFSGPGNQFPETLDQTGLFADTETLQPVFGLVPYDVNTPLWTDGAKKKRWLFVPPNSQVTLNAAKSSQLAYPVGTLLLKHFTTPSGEPVETRVIVKKEDLNWYFGTYVWEEGANGRAVLSRNPRTIQKEGLSFRIPSEKECQLCHNSQVNAEPILGLEGYQMSPRPGSLSNSLREMKKYDVFSTQALTMIETTRPIDLPSDPTLSIERRARAYLAINCSSCHQPGGAAQEKKMDMRINVPIEETNLLAEKRIVPGQPSESLIIKKFTSQTERMPPLSLVQDPTGLEVLNEWIRRWPGASP